MIRLCITDEPESGLTLEALRAEIMASFQEVKDDVAAALSAAQTAAANAAEVRSKVDVLIAKFDDLLAAGGGASLAQLDELRTDLAGISSAIGEIAASDQATEDAVDPKIA